MKDTENTAADFAEKLGLVEVPWFSSLHPGRHSVLLDGGRGSFALSTGANWIFNPDQVASWLWSSDIAHHVRIAEDKITVSRWDDPSAERIWSRGSVENKVETFYDYLLVDSVKSRFDVVEHSIDVFRRIRSYVYENRLPDESSIHIFLYVIASMLSTMNQIAYDDPTAIVRQFALDEAQLEPFQRRGKDTLVALVEQFRVPSEAPRALEMIPELLVRHAGGTVFQEAHFEIIRSSPTDLFSLPGRAEVKIDTRGGTHFTPPALARAIVEQSFWNVQLGDSVTILDPSCGAGAFLHEVLRYLQRIQYKGRISLLGFDISENAVAIARFVLGQAIRDWPDVQLERLEIHARDSLGEVWPDSDFILMNPPFISWGGLTRFQRDQVKEILGRRYVGRPDYSMAFIEKAISNLREGGVLGALLPASVLSTEASLRWRRHILEQAAPILLSVLGDYGIFRHAIVEVACAVFLKTEDVAHAGGAFLSLWTSDKRGTAGEGIRHLRKLQAARAEGYAIKNTASLSGEGWRVSQIVTSTLKDLPDWRPRPNRLGDVLEQSNKAFATTVRDIFHVREGVRAGLRKAFIISGEIYEHLPVQERRFFKPIAENKNIRKGRIGPHDFIFYPDAKELQELSTEDDVKRLLPSYYERYLEPSKKDLLARKSLRGRDWWVLNRSRTYFRTPAPKIVSSFFGNAGTFALDLDGSYVVVQGFAWFLQAPIRESIDGFPEQTRGSIQERILFAYLAILNSALFSLLLAEFCPHVAGGQFNLSKRFIDHIPVPNLVDDAQQSVSLGSVVWSLATEGELIHSGAGSHRPGLLNELVAQVYRVPLTSWPINDK
jgi:adenine-specific DNA-methyltransferase